MVLGKLPHNPKTNPNPNPNRGTIFLGAMQTSTMH